MQILSTIANFLIDPVTIFLLLIGTGFLFKTKKPTAWFWKGCFWTAAFWFYIMTTPFVPDTMVYMLEKQYNPILVQAHEGTELAEQAESYLGIDIVILGAGHDRDPRLPSTSMLKRNSLARLAEGVRLYRLIPESRLVFAGHNEEDARHQVEVHAEAAMELGADLGNRSRYAMLMHPSDTWEESGAYKHLIVNEGNEAAGRRVIVVTNAMHMPRAIGGFRKRGFDPVASPALYEVKQKITEQHALSFDMIDFLPSPEPVGMFKSVIKEYAGHVELWFLRDRGWD